MGINVLFVHAQGYSGGVQAMFNIYSELEKNKEIKCYLCYFGKNNIAKEKGVYDKKTIFVNSGLLSPLTLLKLIRIIKANNINILYTHGPAAHVILSFLNIILRKKLIVHLHGDFKNDSVGYGGNNYFKKIIRKILFKTSVTNFIVVSEFLKNSFISEYKVDEKKVVVIYNGIKEFPKKNIDVKFISEIKKKYTIKNKDFIIINVGSLTSLKNQKLLIPFVELCIKSKINLKILIIGEGRENEILEKTIRDKGLNKYIFLVGYANEKELYNWYKLSNMTIITSLYESFGLVIIESMSMNNLILAPKVGGIPEILKNKFLLYSSNDYKDLYSKFNYLYNTPSLMKKIERENKEVYLNNFISSIQIKKIKSVLMEIKHDKV